LRWLELDADDTAHHPTAIADIFARRLDGMTISGVFDPDACARASRLIDDHIAETTPAMFGPMLGMSLANIGNVTGDPHDRTVYLDEIEHCRELYRQGFGFDPHERMAEVVAPMAGGLVVEPPTEGGRPYNPGNIRRYEPGSGGLPAHAGNEFLMHEDGSASHLATTTITRDHLSYFIVLQPPEEGGALSVYDLLFETHEPLDPQWTASGRDDRDFDELPAKRISPDAGGMVLFGGGWRWHRVDEIRGSVPRITYGGFGGRSVDGRSLHFWF
jgi:hypothetical protein